jgi:NAD(P)-dependent dehydrogenase (short-subunit alcohol dehydrogenase family)
VLLQRDLTGKVVLVTGGNTGIGYEAALQLARQRATVIIACRDAARAGAAVEKIKSLVPTAMIAHLSLDLADLGSVRSFAVEFRRLYDRLDVLMCNAGVMVPPHLKTKEGFELQMGTNHLGHFLLTALLRPLLEATATASEPARVVLVSSVGHRFGYLRLGRLGENTFPGGIYERTVAYGASKLANLLFAKEFAHRYPLSAAPSSVQTGAPASASAGGRVLAVSCHPGVVRTELMRHLPLLHRLMDTLLAPLTHTCFKAPVEGAQTQLFLTLAPAQELQHGGYYADCAPSRSLFVQQFVGAGPAGPAGLGAALWEESERLVGLSTGAGPSASSKFD